MSKKPSLKATEGVTDLRNERDPVLDTMAKAFGIEMQPDIRLTMLSDKVCVIEAVNGCDRKILGEFKKALQDNANVYAVLAPEGLRVEVTR